MGIENPYQTAYRDAASRQAASKGTAKRAKDGNIEGIGGLDPESVGGFLGGVIESENTRNSAKNRSDEISREMETTQGDEGEYQNLFDQARQGIDATWHDAGQNVAESYARRGLGGSGMDNSDQFGLASKRVSAIEDAELKARAAAIANQRSDLAQEQQALVGVQTSDINAQRLAMERAAQEDQILADAIAALAETGVGYYTEAQKKKDAAAAAEKKAVQ